MAVAKSPSVRVPAFTAKAASTSTMPMPILIMAAWPVLRTESEVCDWIEAPVNFAIETSKRAVSCFSALKYFTVS